MLDLKASITKLIDRMQIFMAGLQTQGVRLSQVEAVTSEHTIRHERWDARMTSIEEKIRELEALKNNLSRSPRHFPAPKSPRSPRSPRHSHFGRNEFLGEEDPDFDLEVGGWIDARRDAIQETRNILQDAQVLDQLDEVWAPYSRTSFVKIRLILDAGLQHKRLFSSNDFLGFQELGVRSPATLASFGGQP